MPEGFTVDEVAKSYGLTADERANLIAFAKHQRDLRSGQNAYGEALYDAQNALKLFTRWKAYYQSNHKKNDVPPYGTIEEFARIRGLADDECEALNAYAERHNMKGGSYYAAAVEKLINQWENDPNGKGRFVGEKVWKDYVKALINLGAASKRDLAFVHYVCGAKSVDFFANPDNNLLPVVLRIDAVERMLKIQTADFVENPIEYKVRMELPLENIIWAAVSPVSDQGTVKNLSQK